MPTTASEYIEKNVTFMNVLQVLEKCQLREAICEKEEGLDSLSKKFVYI
jgi:hypothetical protein